MTHLWVKKVSPLVAGEIVVDQDGSPMAVFAQPHLIYALVAEVSGDENGPDEVLPFRQHR